MRPLSIFVLLTLILALSVSCNHSEGDRPDANSLAANTRENTATTKPTQSLCDVNFDSLDGKEVVLNAILITGREYSYLYDPRCRGKKEYELWYRIASNDLHEKLDSIIHPENPEYKRVGLIRIRADFQGIIRVDKETGFGPNGYYSYELRIHDISNIFPVEVDVPYPWQSTSDEK